MPNVEELVKPYKVTHFFDAEGNYAAGMIEYQDVLKVDGVVRSRTIRTDPVHLDEADLPELYSDVAKGALTKVDELQAELAELNRTMAASQLSIKPFEKTVAEMREALTEMTAKRDAEKARGDTAEQALRDLRTQAVADISRLGEMIEKAEAENGGLRNGLAISEAMVAALQAESASLTKRVAIADIIIAERKAEEEGAAVAEEAAAPA